MKKFLLIFVSILVLFWPLVSDNSLEFLQIKEPTDISKSKNCLLFKMENLEHILKTVSQEKLSANIDLATTDNEIILKIGKIKNGKIKWRHKKISNEWLLIKFEKAVFPDILKRIREKSKRPGLQIMLTESKKKFDKTASENFLVETKIIKTTDVFKNFEITCIESPDLTVSLKYPVSASPGETLGDYLAVTVSNNGPAPAKNFAVELVLSSDNQIPYKKSTYAENFQEDVMLKDGREEVPILEPGKTKQLIIKGSIKIPDDAPPGKYYLGAVIDPENKIDEIIEDNNIFSGFFLINMPEPKRMTLNLSETRLIFEPATYGVKVICQGGIFSDGKDWRKCRIRPYIYQIKHVNWQNFHWEINTLDKSVWEIREQNFCKTGGKAKELKIKVEVQGGSKVTPPRKFILRLSETELKYEPSTKKFSTQIYGKQIAYTPFWGICKLASHLYHLRHYLWNNYFLEINTLKKEINKITEGTFCQKGGTSAPLDIKLTVED